MHFQIVGHECLGARLAHDRVPTLGNDKAGLGGERGRGETQGLRALGKAGEYIEFRGGARGAGEVGHIGAEPFEQCFIKRLLELQGPGAAGQGVVFERLQGGRDVAFGVLHGLPPDVLGRNRVAGSARDLDVVTVYPL